MVEHRSLKPLYPSAGGYLGSNPRGAVLFRKGMIYMKERELLKIIFEILDKIEYEYPTQRDDVLIKLSKLYGADIKDTIDCFLDVAWSKIDNINPDEIIINYMGY